jgi:DNA-binding transcriptional ArsR family regulator
VTTQLRGAARDVLNELDQGLQCGRDTRSYLDISLESGYSVPAVVQAIQRLQNSGYIRVIKQGSSKPNRYERLSEERRRLLMVARSIGLIQ